jgi:hypothetical protein
MKNLIVALLFLFSLNINAQSFFKQVYNDFLKYGSIYGAGDVKNSIEAKDNSYFVRTNPENLYDIPEVIDNTPEYPFDYRYGFGIRKLARFNYERKPKNYYDGTENQLAFTAPSSAITGLEYQFHFEKERWRGEMFENNRFFIKHTGKYHIAKLESRQVGKINVEYQSGELRFRLPIGKKLSLSAGAVYRTHDRAYGYNPIQIWLNEKDDEGNAVNPWWTLGYQYGFIDIPYQSIVYNQDGTTSELFAWLWQNAQGDVVAWTDEQFRDQIFGRLMNRFNKEAWSELESWAEVAPIVGLDFYHYKSNFWLHAYANWILPYHHYVQGDVGYSYLHRNGWNHEGHHDGHSQSNGDQWSDYSAGLNTGIKISKHIGLYIEGEYAKLWDSEIFNTSVGINYTFK